MRASQEIDLGEWDQLTDDEARALDPALFDARAADKWNVHVPGGENYDEVAARATRLGAKPDRRHLRRQPWRRSPASCAGLFLGLDWQAMSALDEPQGVVFRVRGSQVAQLPPVGQARFPTCLKANRFRTEANRR